MRTRNDMRALAILAVACGLILAGCGAGEEVVAAAPVVQAEQAAAPVEVEVEQSEPAPDAPGEPAERDPDASDEELAISFARCMRSEGIDFADPGVNPDGSVDMLANVTPGSLQPNSATFQAAVEICGPIVAGASFLPGADIDEAVAQDNLLAFAQCLRDLGYDVIDPKLSDIQAGGPGALTRAFGENFDPTDPGNADAVQQCQRVIQGDTSG